MDHFRDPSPCLKLKYSIAGKSDSLSQYASLDTHKEIALSVAINLVGLHNRNIRSRDFIVLNLILTNRVP